MTRQCLCTSSARLCCDFNNHQENDKLLCFSLKYPAAFCLILNSSVNEPFFGVVAKSLLNVFADIYIHTVGK